jgi:hypothetical protein
MFGKNLFDGLPSTLQRSAWLSLRDRYKTNATGNNVPRRRRQPVALVAIALHNADPGLGRMPAV